MPAIWRILLPRLSGRVGMAGPLSAVAVAVLAAGAILAADGLQLLVLTRPWALAALALVPWLWWIHACGRCGLPRSRARLALATRYLLLVLAALALAEPRAVRGSEGLAVIYAVDVSRSIGDRAIDEALRFVTGTAGGKGERDQAGLVVFGRTAAVELPPAQSLPFEAVNVQVDSEGTDLSQALRLAAAVLSDERAGRIVLISDGAATQGDVGAAVEELRGREIPVDVVPIDYRHAQEVWIDALELPRQVKVGETYEASVLLCAINDGAGELVLRENGQEVARERVTYHSGKNRYRLPLRLRQAGYYEYAATIEVPAGEDGWRANNTALASLFLRGEGRVLLVIDGQGQVGDHLALEEALRAARRAVDVKLAGMLSADPMALANYDCIILVNVAADSLDRAQQQALHDAVFNLGCGLVMVGGERGFGAGGWRGTPVETALPVQMDISQRKYMPKGALAIVLHTCEFPNGNTWAKRITKQAIQVLNSQDEAGVLAYSWGGAKSGDCWIVPFGPVADMAGIDRAINAAEIGDMPSFGPAMQLAFNALSASDAAIKHTIVISDGDPSPPPPELLAAFQTAKISVTTISIFPHGDTEQKLMKSIAQATGGRHYFPQSSEQLPGIFVKEARTISKNLIQNRTFVPELGFPSPILKGLDRLPSLHGYVLTMPKDRAQVVLDGPEQDDPDPVLAVWRYGIGKSAAFTSDLAPGWGRDWVAWDRFKSFVEQLVIDVSRPTATADLAVRTWADGDRGWVEVEDQGQDPGSLALGGTVAQPDGSQRSIALDQVAPGRYQGSFPLAGTGRYQVAVIGADGRREARAMDSLVVSYAPEYRRFSADPALLERIARGTAGRMLSGQEKGQELFAVPRHRRLRSSPVFDLVLALLVVLFALDVGLRRVQVDWAFVRALFVRRRGVKSEERMRALLARKQAVAEAHRGRGEVQVPLPPAPSIPTPAVKPALAPPQTKSTTDPTRNLPQGLSTTGRLLDLKRRRNQQDKE